jgi:hypothetical protein
MIFATIFGIPLGFIAAKRYGTWIDQTSLIVSLIGISIPIFFLAIILKYIFSVRLGWLPSVGRQDPLLDAEHPTNFFILDAIITRNWDAFVTDRAPDPPRSRSMIRCDHRPITGPTLDVRMAIMSARRARRVSRRTVDWRHLPERAASDHDDRRPAVGLFSGAVLTRRSAWPGVGSWFVDAIANRDTRFSRAGFCSGGRVRLREPHRGHHVRVHQPENPDQLMSVAEFEGRQVLDQAPQGLWSDAFSRVRRNPGAIIGFSLVGSFLIMAIFAPLIAPYGPRDVVAPLTDALTAVQDHWAGSTGSRATSCRARLRRRATRW